MEHINIISKEAITTIAPEISNVVCILGFLIIIFLMGCLFYNHKIGADDNKRTTLIQVITWVSCIGVAIIIILGIVGAIFFRMPTGRYRYQATIDKEQMTVAEYEEFMNAYSHSKCKDGIYYFEDWPDDYKKYLN